MQYYDALYGKNQRLVLWGVVVSESSVCAECGALGDFLPKEMELFTDGNIQVTPITTISLKALSGLADNGEGLDTDLKFAILKE